MYANLTTPATSGYTIALAPGGANLTAPNTVTITTTAAHNFSVGQIVAIGMPPNPAPVVNAKGIPIPGYTGTFQITSIPSSHSFTVTNANPGLTPGGNTAVTTATVTPQAPPIKPFAAGNFQETLLRLLPDTAPPERRRRMGHRRRYSIRLITANSTPAGQMALLQKIYNNTTTTSNAFAVWFTIGFFEVVDETVRPPRLGQEIGRAQNANIRHRFFAVVDRSGMQIFNTTSTSAVTGQRDSSVLDQI